MSDTLDRKKFIDRLNSGWLQSMIWPKEDSDPSGKEVFEQMINLLEWEVESGSLNAHMGDAVNKDGLLPCPFCGSWPFLDSNAEAVHCPKRKCPMEAGWTYIKDWNTRAQASGGWRPMKTAPRDGSEIWLYSKFDGQFRGRYNVTFSGEEKWHNRSANRWANPTHWQPLPSPPVKE